MSHVPMVTEGARSNAGGPLHRGLEARNRCEFASVRAYDVLELPGEYLVDGRAAGAGEVAEHVALIARDAGTQRHQADSVREKAQGVVAEGAFDLRLGPRAEDGGNHLLAWDAEAD